ncbi:hypothetical protein [Burkholderia glumae]|uniref:hypothetical protein n=1 Tax=Burkholderia glumae TaxID=337 RepID=UPI00214F6C16|nr:hypothetical protein [Burkholderia glumae]
MRDIPIMFTPDMAAGARNGAKTQTRRPMRPQPYDDYGRLAWMFKAKNCGSWGPEGGAPDPAWLARCPYGVGDQLWVRETFVAFGRWETRFSVKKGRDEWHFVDMTLDTGRQYRYSGDLPNAKRDSVTPTWWRRPAIFMPRAASRTQLEVVSNRIERVQQIREADAAAEGVEPPETDRDNHDWAICPQCGGTRLYNAIGPNLGVMPDTDCFECDTHIKRFRHLWDSINTERGLGWDANPWVWVVEFRRMEG